MKKLSNIPLFPDFRQLSISDESVFTSLFKKYQPNISEYTFTNLFAWKDYYDFHLSKTDTAVIVLTKKSGKDD